jgi:hypothetical protein
MVVLAHNMVVLAHNTVVLAHNMVEPFHRMAEQPHLSTESHSMVVYWVADWCHHPLAKPRDEIVREGKRFPLRNRKLNSS